MSSKTYQIKCPSDKMISHTGTVLTPSTADHDHTVLLHVMSCGETYQTGFLILL